MLWPQFRLRNGVTLVQAPPSKLSPWYQAFQRIWKHVLPYRWMRWRSTRCGPQVPDERECKQFVLYHVTAQRGWLATAHVSTTLTTAQDIVLSRLQNRPPEWNTPSRHRSFPLESFGLSLFNMVSGRAVAMQCVSQTDVEKKKPQFKGYLNFGQSYSVLWWLWTIVSF